SHYIPILPCRAARGQGLGGFAVPNRPTLPALISLNNQTGQGPHRRPGRDSCHEKMSLPGQRYGSKETTATAVKTSQGVGVQQSADKRLQGCFLCGFRLRQVLDSLRGRHRDYVQVLDSLWGRHRDYVQVLDSLRGRHRDYVQVLDSLRGRHRDYVQVLDSLWGRHRDYVQVLDSLLGRHGDYVQVLDSLRGRHRDYVQVLDSLRGRHRDYVQVLDSLLGRHRDYVRPGFRQSAGTSQRLRPSRF
ncbi:hypothetical protein GBF38_011996, partial [Nibea albiflora]